MSLSVSNLVRVSVNLSPLAVPTRSFGTLLICGDSNVINGLERVRTYLTLDAVVLDFGTSAPEYKAAALYFGQTPRPAILMIGRWLRTATSGLLMGGILTPTEQAISSWTSITTGVLSVTIDAVVKNLTGLDFSGQTNLNGVATVITTALSAAGSCVWTGSFFEIISATTGISSIVTFASTGIATQMKLTSSLAQATVPGYAAEAPVDCAAAMADLTSAWYGLMFQASTQPTDDQSIAVSDFIEGLDITRMYGVTITNTNVLSAVVTSDLASRMSDNGYLQSLCQYSANLYAVASLFGREFSVNFNGNNTTITVMYKQEPGVTGEDLTQTEANTLKSKRCNVFVDYVNDTMIIQYGVMSGPAYIDEIHGLDWLQNALQTAGYNLLYLTKTKIPQTDSGVNAIINALDSVLGQAVLNGLVAPGVWNADGFGNLASGDYLKSGYYIFAASVSTQSQSDRDARIAPPIQIAVKLAGAIQEIDVLVDVNR